MRPSLTSQRLLEKRRLSCLVYERPAPAVVCLTVLTIVLITISWTPIDQQMIPCTVRLLDVSNWLLFLSSAYGPFFSLLLLSSFQSAEQLMRNLSDDAAFLEACKKPHAPDCFGIVVYFAYLAFTLSLGETTEISPRLRGLYLPALIVSNVTSPGP